MNILAIDTATEACSVALKTPEDRFERYEVCPQQHSQKILPMIDQVLAQANVTISNIDYLVFGQGPGSFTGVRIATGVIQGLALGAELPVVGVSTLAAMAQQCAVEQGVERVCVATDARMNEVYFAQFERHQDHMHLVGSEQVCSPEAALHSMSEKTQTLAGTGWHAYDALSVAIRKIGEPSVLLPRASYMLPLAEIAIARGEALDVEQVSPVYVRDTVTWKKLPGR